MLTLLDIDTSNWLHLWIIMVTVFSLIAVLQISAELEEKLMRKFRWYSFISPFFLLVIMAAFTLWGAVSFWRLI